jgi:hypothetical protein
MLRPASSRKYQPGSNAGDLPAVLAKRRANRGMEGLTLDSRANRRLSLSPLDDGKASIVIPGADKASNEISVITPNWCAGSDLTLSQKKHACMLTLFLQCIREQNRQRQTG